MATPHIRNRDALTEQLVAELAGPGLANRVPSERHVDWDGSLADVKPDDRGPFRQAGTGEEILTRGTPLQRYGVGVLYPLDAAADGEIDPEDGAEADAEADAAEDRKGDRLPDDDGSAAPSPRLREIEDDRDDFDLSNANWRRPSSMGVSLLAVLEEGGSLNVDVGGGRYERRPDRGWWLRRPVRETVGFDVTALIRDRQQEKPLRGHGPLQLRLQVRARPYRGSRNDVVWHLLTVSLVNRTDGDAPKASGDKPVRDECCLFQSRFAVRAATSGGEGAIRPYPERTGAPGDDEAESAALLYRRWRTFAVGHGCAADWDGKDAEERVAEVRAEHLPTFETPSIDHDIGLAAPMAPLAGLAAGDDGFASLEAIVGAYEAWIAGRRREAAALPGGLAPAADNHLRQCEVAAQRMRDGVAYLRADGQAREAFVLANRAMLMQWERSRIERREADWNAEKRRMTFEPPHTPFDLGEIGESAHAWRAFQIAFLLTSIPSAADDAREHRDTVELIWFPTGGGKTEAYLGLAAFHMFLRRLRDPSHAAVDVLMRYTLRLLTAQQFQRGAALLCAMEHLRRERPERLGGHPFEIGLWVGAGSTPNWRKDAIAKLRDMEQRKPGNPFVLLRCPWCQAPMGPLDLRERGRGRRRVRGAPPVLGYRQNSGTVVLECGDRDCFFSDGLPILVIDEDIYERRPSFVVATVDKFATLAWRPEARTLFGLGPGGERDTRPPGLVIQDELHLISGPLGSMVGLYEAVIEELCTYRGELDGGQRETAPIRPKIVSSTATISRYREQVLALYGRPGVALFPPPGLDAGDSFFGRYARDENGVLAPGRRFVGVHAPVLGSLQAAQVRAWAAVLQSAHRLGAAAERDPWWTLVVFFSSLRELGAAVSLAHSDVRDHLWAIKDRTGEETVRSLHRIKELTGRLQDHEVPAMLESLQVSVADSGREPPIDICLASSILEVGVDIDRLSLMAVAGQPKTTSQYIQVTGRVGRSWKERPGLILSLYSPSRSRDRSHFERFRSYHQRLYAQVEPASVTPFSPPALERALHATMAIYARLAGGNAVARTPRPYPEELMARLRDILAERVRAATSGDEDALAAFGEIFERRVREWRNWERTRWERVDGSPGAIPLLRRSGEYATREESDLSWATPLSLRNVDAECRGTITTLYARKETA